MTPGYPMPLPGAYRDCGTGKDPGCTATRNGRLAMEAQAFIGMMAALQSADNELVRADMARSMIAANAVTAAQFGLVLDLFKNDLTRLDVAKGTAKYVVNPRRALGLAAKYQNSLLGQEFTLLMTSQR